MFLKTSETMIKYGLNMYRQSDNWEMRGTLLYYTELITECTILLVTLAHYGHIFMLHGISLTLNAILFLHMRIVFSNLKDKLKAYSNYLELSRRMRTTYPSVSPEQLAEIDDNCAICREHMESAKQLPCKHVFHEGCLRLWLEHHSSCPTCRRELIGNTPEQQQQQQNEGRRWLPRFRFFQGRRNNNVSDDMVRAVQAVAPHVPEAWIRQDLARTGSPNATLERIFTIFPPPEDEDENRNIPIHREEIEVSDPTANNENVIEEQIKELTQSTPSGFANTAKERQKRLKERTELMKQKAKL